MSVSISNPGRPVDERRLDLLAVRIGRPLPISYRAFLLEHNGGEPDLDHYPIEGMESNPYGEIRMFMGLDAEADYDDIESTWEMLKDQLPPEFLPIGYSSGNDLVCLSLAESDYGTVYFWDSQIESELAPWARSGYSNAFFVAEDFARFLESLDSYEAFAG